MRVGALLLAFAFAKPCKSMPCKKEGKFSMQKRAGKVQKKSSKINEKYF
jgi:hypothetical protein